MTDSLHIAWIPLCKLYIDFLMFIAPITVKHGPLVLCKSSHLLPSYDNLLTNTEELPSSFREFVPYSEWSTSKDFQLGDFILFHNKTIHASLSNISDEYRVSVDTRWCLSRDM